MLVDVPKVRWKDIGGQDDVKQRLQEAVEWPLKVIGQMPMSVVLTL